MVDELKTYEVGQQLKRRRELAEKEIEVIKRGVIIPSEKALSDMRSMLRTIQELNRQAHDSVGQKQANLLYKIQREKQNLNNVIRGYTEFKYNEPKNFYYITCVHKYNKVDKRVQIIIDELRSIKLPGVDEIEKRKSIFGHSGL